MAFEPDYRTYDDGLSTAGEYTDRMIRHLKALHKILDSLTKEEIKSRLDKIIKRAGAPGSSSTKYGEQDKEWGTR